MSIIISSGLFPPLLTVTPLGEIADHSITGPLSPLIDTSNTFAFVAKRIPPQLRSALLLTTFIYLLFAPIRILLFSSLLRRVRPPERRLMYNLLKNIIMAGKNPVSTLTNKVNMAWANGDITDVEKLELEQMIFQYRNPQTEAPELMQLYRQIRTELSTVKSELETIKSRLSTLESGSGTVTTPPETDVTVPEWVMWDGISQKYQYGAVVSHNGKYWINVLQGMQNTWEPGSAGVDERYWKEITKEQAEELISGTINVDDILKV